MFDWPTKFNLHFNTCDPANPPLSAALRLFKPSYFQLKETEKSISQFGALQRWSDSGLRGEPIRRGAAPTA